MDKPKRRYFVTGNVYWVKWRAEAPEPLAVSASALILVGARWGDAPKAEGFKISLQRY